MLVLKGIGFQYLTRLHIYRNELKINLLSSKKQAISTSISLSTMVHLLIIYFCFKYDICQHYQLVDNGLPLNNIYIWFKYDLGQKYSTPQVQSKWDSNS